MPSKSRFQRSTLRRRGTAPKRFTALSIEGLEPRQMMTASATASLNSLGTQISSVASAVSGIIAGDRYENDNMATRAMRIATGGTSQEHSIHAGADVDWVKFTLTERSNVIISTSGASGDTRMWLYGPNSSTRQIEFDDDDGIGAFSRIERTGANSLAPGTYYVKVDEYGNNDTIANYTIRVQATAVSLPVMDPVIPPITILPIVPGDDYANELQGAYQLSLDSAGRASASGSIEHSGDVDMFRFVARGSGQTIIEQNASQNSGLDTYLYVYDSQGREIARNDDYGGTRNSHVTFNATAGATYYVKAAAYRTSTGAYQLVVTGQPATSTPPIVVNPPITPVVPIQPADDYGNTLQNATTLTLGADGSAAASGVIEHSGDVDMFRFTAQTSGRMTIDQQAVTGSGLDTYLVVYDSRSQELTHNDDSGGTRNSHVEVDVISGQSYYVSTGAYGSTIGAYQLAITGPTPPTTLPPTVSRTDDHGNGFSTATSLTLSDLGTANAAGRIERARDVDMFRFVARESGRVTIDQMAASGSQLDSYLYVYDRQGQILASDDDSGDGRNSRASFQATPGQTYFIKAMGYNNSTGDYRLQIMADHPATAVSPIWSWLDTAASVVPGIDGRRALLFGEITVGAQEGSIELANAGFRFLVDLGDMAGHGVDARDGYANVYVIMPISTLGVSVGVNDLIELATPSLGYDFGIVFASTVDGTSSSDVLFHQTTEWLTGNIDTISGAALAVDFGDASAGPSGELEPSIALGTISAGAYLMRTEIPIWQSEVRRDVIDAAMATAITAANPA